MNLFDWTKEHPLSVLMACTAFILFGGISFFELAFEELPDLQIPEIRIAAAFPGFPPEEMEQLVTIPMENALSTVRDVSSMDSVSKAGISSVTLRFDWGADLDQASLEVRESIDTLYPLLPQGVKKPVVYTSDLSHRPCVTLALIPPPGRGIEELYSLVQ
jgi:HAE1 family hydrophobic/amphiphilic exporter-1